MSGPIDGVYGFARDRGESGRASRRLIAEGRVPRIDLLELADIWDETAFAATSGDGADGNADPSYADGLREAADQLRRLVEVRSRG